MSNKALILIDIQNDFLPGGALAVPGGDQIIEPVRKLAEGFDTIVLTQDWHPAGHSSFASSHAGAAPFDTREMSYGDQVLWPDHCVQGSHGAAFNLPDEVLNRAALILRKGMNPSIDSYSAFMENDRTSETGLGGWLADRGIEEVVLAGLALDYCVAYSAIDAARMGFRTRVAVEACRGISDEGVKAQILEMLNHGVSFAES